MKKSTKNLILILSILSFFILSFVAVTYALGYKYDFVKNKFIKTGSLGITTNTASEAYLNNELAGSTSFLGNAFSVRRLLPRTYDLRVQNEESQAWQKLVEIDAGFFVDFPKIVLVLKSPIETTLASASMNFKTNQILYFDSKENTLVFGNKQKVETIDLKSGKTSVVASDKIANILESYSSLSNKNNEIISPDGKKTVAYKEHEIRVSWLNNSSYQPYKNTGDSLLVTRSSQNINSIQWYKDSEHLIADVGGILKFIEIDTRGGTNIFDIGENENGLFYYSENSNSVYKISGKKIIQIIFEK